MKDGTAARMAIQPVTQPRILTGQDVETLQTTIHQVISSRAYQLYEARGCEAGHEIDDWVQAEQELCHAESLEVIDTGQEIRIRAKLNSLTGPEVIVGVSPQRVIILGDRLRSGPAGLDELTSAKPAFIQVVDLVPKIDPTAAAVQLSNGVLEVTLPAAG